MIEFGTLEGSKEHVNHFLGILASIGPTGSFTLKCSSGERKLWLTDSVSISFTESITFDFEIKGEVAKLKFREPHPVGRFKILKAGVSEVGVTLDQIDIKLDWMPDGYLEVK